MNQISREASSPDITVTQLDLTIKFSMNQPQDGSHRGDGIMVW